jgi:tetratricopeptide (TPR) repeat protein
MSDLNEAQKLDPSDADTYLMRGDVEKARQLYDAALKDFDEFSERASKSPRGMIGRGLVLEATGRPKEALAAFEGAVALDPANSQALAARDRLHATQDSGGH